MNRFQRVVGAFLLAGLPTGSALAQIPELGGNDPVKVETFLSADTVRPGDAFQVAVVFTVSDPYHIYGNDEKTYVATSVKVTPGKGFGWEVPRYPASHPLKFLDETVRILEKRAIVFFAGHAGDDLEPGEKTVELRLDYMSCTNTTCLAPRTDVPITLKIPIAARGTDVKPANAEIFKDSGAAGEESEIEKLLKSGGIFGAILLLLAGGIATAFTPCVLPMIPFTIAFFTSQVDRSKMKTLVLALTYTAGIVTTFSVLGFLFGRAGSSAGTLLGNTWVVLAMVFIFAALGLSCFGLFELTVPAPIMAKLGGGSREGRLGAYVMGMLLGVVAAPCIGPVLAGLLIYIAKQGSGLSGLFYMFVFGVGLGLPFILLAFASGLIPRAGAWMMWVKEAFGVLLFATALWYLSTVVRNPRIIVLLGGVGAVLLAIRYVLPVLRKSESEHRSPILGVLAVVAALYLLAGPLIHEWTGLPSVENWFFHKSTLPWRTDYDAALADAKREGRPVLVDFTAAWCQSCGEMERMMEGPDVAPALKRFVLIRLDCTSNSGEGARILREKYQYQGLPTTAYYDSKGNVHLFGDKNYKLGKIEKEDFLEIVRFVY